MAVTVEQRINRFLSWFWPEDAQGNRAVWFHWQNLNDRREPPGLPYEGRSWLHSPLGLFGFEWHLWSKFCGFSVGADQEDGGVKVFGGLPPVALWLTLPVPRSWSRSKPWRTFGFDFFEVRVFDWAIWWKVMHGEDWSSRDPKWKNGNWHFLDTFLGRTQYTEGKGKKRSVSIPMPEGCYDATVEIGEDTWKRPRGFARRLRRARVDVPQGIPHQGKGENDYDCGEDRLYGWSGPARNIEDAIAKTIASALEYRRKYDGNVMAKYPSPAEQARLKAEQPPPIQMPAELYNAQGPAPRKQ